MKKRMMKKSIMMVVMAICVLSLSNIVLGIQLLNPIGPSVLAISELLKTPDIDSHQVDISFWRSFDEVISSIVTGKADVIVMPVSLGANLYNRDMPVKLLGVNLWRTFSLVAREKPDRKAFQLHDLKGQELYMAQGRGQTSDVAIRYLLQKEGIDPDKDLTIRYLSPPEIVPLMNAEKVDWAILPEPFASLSLRAVQGSSIILSLEDLWGEALGIDPRIPTTGIFVTDSFWENNPEGVKAISQALKKSAEWLLEDPDQAIETSSQYLGTIPIPVLHQSLERSLYLFRNASQIMEEVLEFLDTVHQIDPQAVTAVPDRDFFAF